MFNMLSIKICVCMSLFQGQILCLSRLEETVRDADFIFEAVIDDLQVKQDLFESEFFCSPQ